MRKGALWRKFGKVSPGSVLDCALWRKFEKASLISVVKRILWSRIVEASLGIFEERFVEKVWGSFSRKCFGVRSVGKV